MTKKLFLIFLLSGCHILFAQENQSTNLIIVTLDGLRWQEVFYGADPVILKHTKYLRDRNGISSLARRDSLLPFFWSTIALHGQMYGNRREGSRVNCANPHWFSYPGYAEMLSGVVDRRVRSNRKIENPNPTILEFLNDQEQFRGSVAAFGSWDVFPFIMREEKSGVIVNAGNEPAEGSLVDDRKTDSSYIGTRDDALTFQYAFDYLKTSRPSVLFIGLDETDHYAHHASYDNYLNAAHHADEMIATLWRWVQSDPEYKDRTTLIITTDHGRGRGQHNWRNHGRMVRGSGQVWFAVMGPDTPAGRATTNHPCYYLRQLAPTMASILGYRFGQSNEVVIRAQYRSGAIALLKRK